jgi:hypothetical protein
MGSGTGSAPNCGATPRGFPGYVGRATHRRHGTTPGPTAHTQFAGDPLHGEAFLNLNPA